jgi:lysozyme
MPFSFGPYFPFRRDNRKPDGTWKAPDATDDNIKGTSVDPRQPVWPRWTQTPPDHGEGEFVSGEPFFDIDEISQKAEFYPPGRPLTDKNVNGNPASRQRVGDMPGGNLWRRRLLVGPVGQAELPSRYAAASADSSGEPWAPGASSPRGHLSAATSASSGDAERSGHADDRPLGQHATNDVLVSDQRRMVTSSEGREFIKRHEGRAANAYSDPRGFPTIGYGHRLTPPDAAALPPNATLSDAAIGALLTQDLEAAERAIYRNVNNVGALSQRQFDALVSFVFNVGEGTFRNSRMRALINSGNHAGAANEFRRFVLSRGTRLPGLVNRRTLEENLFSKGTYQ